MDGGDAICTVVSRRVDDYSERWTEMKLQAPCKTKKSVEENWKPWTGGGQQMDYNGPYTVQLE